MVPTAARKDETAHLEALEAVEVLIAPLVVLAVRTRTAGPIRIRVIREGKAVEKEAAVIIIGQVVRMTVTTTVGVVADLVIDLLVQVVLRRIRRISWLRVCVTKSL